MIFIINGLFCDIPFRKEPLSRPPTLTPKAWYVGPQKKRKPSSESKRVEREDKNLKKWA